MKGINEFLSENLDNNINEAKSDEWLDYLDDIIDTADSNTVDKFYSKYNEWKEKYHRNYSILKRDNTLIARILNIIDYSNQE